jgi:hypothetical protein
MDDVVGVGPTRRAVTAGEAAVALNRLGEMVRVAVP